MLGCAIPVAIVFFAFGMLGSLVVPGMSVVERADVGAMTGGMAFLASTLLYLRDRAKMSAAKRQVHQRLMARNDVADADFCGVFPIDESILIDVREALARFFDVPSLKIHTGDNLRDDYKYNVLEPSLHMFAIARILRKRGREIGSFRFPECPISSVGDFANEISRLVKASRPTPPAR
jgi:hypothetical protein